MHVQSNKPPTAELLVEPSGGSLGCGSCGAPAPGTCGGGAGEGAGGGPVTEAYNHVFGNV